jgi:hypothetical protein
MEHISTKNFGAIMDRTLKLIRQNYLQAFRDQQADITTEQWVLLDRLAEGDGIPQTDLANDSFKNAPTVSRIITLLAKKSSSERSSLQMIDVNILSTFLRKEGNSTKESCPRF